MELVNCNVQWFYYLSNQVKNSLIYSDYYNEMKDISPNLFPVAKDDKKAKKLFTVFLNPLIAFEYQNSLPQDQRNLYEIIPGDTYQKIHFDIDISPLLFHTFDETKFLDQLISILIEITKVDFDLNRDILIFTSHGASKRSYHIIIDNYCLKDCNESRKLLSLINLRCPEAATFIDSKIYNKNRQFRLYGSSKLDSPERVKKLMRDWKYKGQNVRYYSDNEETIFLSSLVSNIDKCEELTIFGVSAPRPENEINLPKNITSQILTLFKSKFNCQPFFEFTEITGNMILTRRTKPSYCDIHKRVHDNENPYFWISKSGIIRYCCRREGNSSAIIGSIAIENNDMVIDDKFSVKDEEETKYEGSMNNFLHSLPVAKTSKKVVRDRNFYAEKKKLLNMILDRINL